MKLVSPFVATIILVIITISIGIGVYMYLSSVTKTSSTEEVINCLGGDFKIINFNYPKYEFKYSREIIIDNTQNSNNLNDYQILVTIDTSYLISNNYLKNDCSDIRFLDSDKSTLLNYWIEGPCNSQNTKIWVKVPNIPANSKKIIYFVSGNENVNSLSNGDLVFDFFDDFLGTSLNTSKWYVVSGTSYTLSNGILKITVGAIGLQSALPFNLNAGYLTEAKIQYNSNSESEYSGVLEVSSSRFTAGGNANADATVLYMVEWPSGSTSVCTWIGSGSSASYNIGYTCLFSMTLNTWYILGIETTPSTAALWKDYSRLKSYSVSWTKNIKYLSLGKFDGTTSNIKDTSYDWIRVRKYTYPEPTISLGNELGSIIIKPNTYSYSFNLYFIGNPQSSLGSKYIAYITLKNDTVIKKDIDISPCNLGSECISSPTINIQTDNEIKKIEICSKACSYVCSKYVVEY